LPPRGFALPRDNRGMSDPATLLALVESAIEDRLSGGAVDEWSMGSERFKGMSLSELRSFRAELITEVNSANNGGAIFASLVPLRDRGH